MLHLPAAQLDFNAKLPQHNGLLLPIPRLFKAVIEKFIAALFLLLLSPLFIILTILVKLTSHGPAFYVSERIGRDGKTFKILKYRTMRDQSDAQLEQILSESPKLAQEWSRQFKLDNDPRITPLGRFLRKTSLDELPELINIVKGDMAVVGPRPLLVRYLDRYNDEQKHRHDVRPGLTGYAQAHGRNAISWEEKFALDVEYTGMVSFRTDVKVIADTVKSVVKHDGISSDTSATMEEFMGSGIEV